MSVISICNESDAYDALEKLKKGVFPEDASIEFINWPKLELRVVGDGYNSTITPTLMKGFMALQQAIYKSYTLAKYNSVHTTKLTKQERKDLEILVHVEPGSSIFGIDFQAALEKLMEQAGGKLTSKEIIIISLVVAVGYFGSTSYKAYLDDRRQIRIAELKSEDQREVIKSLSFMSEQETKRAEMMASLIKDYPKAQNVNAYSENAKTEMIKSVRHADTAEIQGIKLTGEIADELVKNARKKAHQIRLDGDYKILVVDSQNPEVFKVRVKDSNSHDEFWAFVQDESLDSKYQKLIQHAEWSRSVIKLAINAKEINGEIKDAIVIGAKTPEK